MAKHSPTKYAYGIQCRTGRCDYNLPELQTRLTIPKVLTCISCLLCGPSVGTHVQHYNLTTKCIFMSNQCLRILEMNRNLSRYHCKNKRCLYEVTIMTIYATITLLLDHRLITTATLLIRPSIVQRKLSQPP